jgi:hypothetical protein
MDHSTHSTLTLPDGTPLRGAAVVPGALQRWSGSAFDPAAVFERLSGTPKQPVRDEIAVSETGLEPLLVTGDHPSLHYRGNALKRHKIWAQADYAGGLRKYGYTGWQHAVSAATRDVQAYPDLQAMMAWLNANFCGWLAQCGLPAVRGAAAAFNHVIFTRYEDEKDFIGMHADKEVDFVPGSYFVVFKLGAARDFAFAHSGEVFWQQTLEAGTAIIVKTGNGSPNQSCKHGVPVSQVPVGPSGSVVFRCIQTVVPWDIVKRNMGRAKEQKKKRRLAKQVRRAATRKGVKADKKA